MTSFLALRASVCAYLWCLIPPVCYIGFPNTDLLFNPSVSIGFRSQAISIGFPRAETSFQPQRILLKAFPWREVPRVRNLVDPYTFCSHLSGLNFAQMLLRVRTRVLTLSAWCAFVFRHGKKVSK